MGVDAKNYAVTVILNPVSGGVKGRTLYEAHCAPLLHLAGFKVSVIRTESDGQAKEIMQLMKDADAVLVAGGDGTVMEVVTGLMRREDRDAAAQVPIGILPVGKNNLTAKSLFPGAENQVRLLGEATMAVVRQLRRPTGVIEVIFGPLDFVVHTYYFFSGGKQLRMVIRETNNLLQHLYSEFLEEPVHIE